MSYSILPGRGRLAASVAVTLAMLGGAAAVTATPAQSAPPAEDCKQPFPVAELQEDQWVHGLSVVRGTEPVQFTGTVLDVMKDGIAPGLDMVIAELTSPELEKEDVGIWQGMSGSPVYAADGRLIGAVAYGLTWGPSDIAGITPFEEMDNYLPGQPAARVQVDRETARTIAARSTTTEAQAAEGFTQLRMPMGVSGLTSQRFAKVAQSDKQRAWLRKDTYRMGVTAAAEDGGPGAETVLAGGNLAAAVSYGDVTMGGVGTATSVCEGRVVGFGHPATFGGETSMTLHPAKAISIIADPVGPSFKLANIGTPVGTIDGDHLSGISGFFGALPEATDLSTRVDYADRTRTGVSHVSVPEAAAATTFYQHIAIHDRVIDAITKGSEEMTWTITGTENGVPFAPLSMTDRFASNYDITFESPWELADTVWALSALPGVTVETVTSEATVIDDNSTWRVAGLEQYRAGAWVALSKASPALVRAGRTLKVRAVLESLDSSTTVPLSFEVPERASGTGGMLQVVGGSWLWSRGGELNSVDQIRKMLASRVRNDAVEGRLFLEGGRRPIVRRSVSEPADKVVYEEKRVRVFVR